MKLTPTVFLLIAASVSGLQVPRSFGAATVAASALLGGPLTAPAQDAPPTALVLNIKADIDPFGAAKNLFSHRGQLQTAVKDFLASAQKLSNDLDGVFPPPPEVTIIPPTAVKQAALDALAGQVRLNVNGEPVYFEVDSQEGFFTLKILSPLLPKLPFLAPTDEQRASMVIPRAQTIYITKVVAPASSDSAPSLTTPFWESTFTLPVVNKQFSLTQAAEATLGVVVGVYATAYGYYVVSQILDERQAEAKRKENLAKMAAKKASSESSKNSSPPAVTEEVKVEMVPEEPAKEVAPVLDEKTEEERKSMLPWKK
jgi:hypothetical protein